MPPNLTVIDNRPLTDMQERFAYAMANGLGPTQAATAVGYGNPSVAGARMGSDPRIRAVIKSMRTRRLDKLASLSLHELELILKDRRISPAVRLKAITLSLALGGHSPAAMEADEDAARRKDIGDMTVEELNAFIATEKERRAGAAKPVVDAELVQAVRTVGEAGDSGDDA